MEYTGKLYGKVGRKYFDTEEELLKYLEDELPSGPVLTITESDLGVELTINDQEYDISKLSATKLMKLIFDYHGINYELNKDLPMP